MNSILPDASTQSGDQASRHIICPHLHARLCETLERAALRHDWDAVFKTLDAGADIDHLDGWLLRMAASARRPDIVEQLIARSARRKSA